jgi:hypothetical protein
MQQISSPVTNRQVNKVGNGTGVMSGTNFSTLVIYERASTMAVARASRYQAILSGTSHTLSCCFIDII